MNKQNKERCECHECMQARWRMSLQGQVATALGVIPASYFTLRPTSCMGLEIDEAVKDESK